MKFIIIIAMLLLEYCNADRSNIDLQPIKNENYGYSIKGATIVFTIAPKKVVLFFSSNVKSLTNPIYTSKQDKAFWLLTQSFIDILKIYNFKKSKFLYVSFYDTNKNIINEDMSLKINLSKLREYDNRDFAINDNRLLKSNNYSKYNLLPLRNLFKNIEVTHKYKVSKKLTNLYKKFIENYTFKSLGSIEFEIDNNQEVINELKQNIYQYSVDNNFNKIKLYINLEFNLNIKDDVNQHTLLEYASVNGHYKIVKLLIDNGANPNIHKKNSENAYLSAKREGYIKIVKLLQPITTMTEYPKISSSNYNASDLKNMCLGVNGKYKNNCYSIKNSDLKNSCLGMNQYPNFAYNIQNNDLKNFTLGASGKYSNSCYNINNSDLKNACIGVSSNHNNCYNIQDENLKNMCIGISTNLNNCYSIR